MNKVLSKCAICSKAYLQIHPMQLEVDKFCLECRFGFGDYLSLTDTFLPEEGLCDN